MHLHVSLIFVGLVFFALVLSSQGKPWEPSGEVSGNINLGTDFSTDGNVGDISEYSDFEDDDDDDDNNNNARRLLNMDGFSGVNVNSMTHLHRERGEILVPCFGMWWPVGGPTYDYVGDYYGDYKKKRKRSRKQKKAAKMKKKKS